MTKEDADSLFEKNSVQELQIILQNLKYRKVTRLDAEKKKYELRNHVGESYRDVIEAADAIGMMKTSAIGLIERFEKAKGLCLVQQHDKKKESTEQSIFN
jgi:hypothetical protein